MEFSSEKCNCSFPGESFSGLIFLDMLFFIMSPQAVVVSAFYSKILLVFYVQGLSQESPMFAQQVTCFRS